MTQRKYLEQKAKIALKKCRITEADAYYGMAIEIFINGYLSNEEDRRNGVHDYFKTLPWK